MLLVLDNVEHLPGVSDLAAGVLQHAPGGKLLLTSRERLNLRGEWVLEIAGLHFSPVEARPESRETYDAVDLFLQAAYRSDVGFSPSGADMASIFRICQLVEGVPLGIELAASWVKALSCAEIAEQGLRALRDWAAGQEEALADHRETGPLDAVGGT